MDADNLSLLANEHVEGARGNNTDANKRNPSVFGLVNIICGPASLVQWKFQNDQSGHVKPMDIASTTTTTTSKTTTFVVSTVIVVTATLLTVLFPNVIVQSINDQSDAYCAIFFISLACWILMAIVVLVAKFVIGGRGIDRMDVSLWPSAMAGAAINFGTVVKLSIYYGVSGVAIFYGRDRFRVLCHLQDPLSAAILPLAVICHLLCTKKVECVQKLACIAVSIIGLFVCVDYQIWDEFTCPGHVYPTLDLDDGTLWTPNEHAMWTIVYVAGLGVLALFYTLLDRLFKENAKDEYVVSTIQMSTNVVETKSSLSFMNTLVLCTWIHFFSWLTVACLFWTDLFRFREKSARESTAGMNSFYEMMLYGTGCFVGIGGDDCPRTAGIMWTFVVLSATLFVALVYSMVIQSSRTRSNVIYSFALMTLALPLSTIWWSVFRIGADGLHWSPKMAVETWFTLVGLPVMIAGLVLYRHSGNRDAIEKKSTRCDCIVA